MPSVCEGEECGSVSVIGCSWLFLAGAALLLSGSGGLPGTEGLEKKSKERSRPGVFMLDRRRELGVGRWSRRVSEG